LKSFSGDIIEIIRGETSFSSGYLDDKERLNKLLNYCREFFKREIKIEITGEKVNTNDDKDIARQPSDLPLPVQDVIRIFNGEIKGEIPAQKKKKNH